MKDIKCPSCGKTFRIDPSSFEEILLQIKDEEFNKQIKERLQLAKEDNKKALEILKRELKIQLIEQNIEHAQSAGCHGIVIGAHDKDFNLDISLLRKWKTLPGSMYTTFQRAFDVLITPEKALNQLID